MWSEFVVGSKCFKHLSKLAYSTTPNTYYYYQLLYSSCEAQPTHSPDEQRIAPHLAHDPLDADSALHLAPPKGQGAVRVVGHLLGLAALEVRVPHEPPLVEALAKQTRRRTRTRTKQQKH